MGTSGAKIPLDAETREYNRKIKQSKKLTEDISKEAQKSKKEWERQIPILGKINSGTLGIASSVTGLTAGVGLLARAWQQVEQARKKAMDDNLGHMASSKKLNQIATSKEHRSQLGNQARMFAATSGKSLAEAEQIVFNLGSAGKLQHLNTFQDASTIEEEITGLVEGSLTTQGAFGGNLTKNTEMLLAASRQSKYGATSLSQASAIAGKQIAGSGTSAAEFFAVLGTEYGTKTADIAANTLRQFIVETSKNKSFQNLRGSSMVETTRNLMKHFADRGISDKDLPNYFGSQEALQGYLTNRSAIQSGSLEKNIEQIENSDGIIQELMSYRTSQDISNTNTRRGIMLSKISNEKRGVEEANQQAILKTKEALAVDSGMINESYVGAKNYLMDNLSSGGHSSVAVEEALDIAQEVIIGKSVNDQKMLEDRSFGVTSAHAALRQKQDEKLVEGMQGLKVEMKRAADAAEATNQMQNNRVPRGAKEE